MIKIAILDDHPMVLKGIESMLEDSQDMELTDLYDRRALLLEGLELQIPDILLLDINMPDGSGLELAKELHKSYPDLRIIGLSNYSEPGFIKSMLRNGARGYLLKNTGKQELKKAITAVYKGEIYLPRTVRDILLSDSIGHQPGTSFIPKLTRREKEVLDLVASEHTNSEIAEKLFISSKTVESHRNNLLQKLGARNTAGLIKSAMEKGLIS